MKIRYGFVSNSSSSSFIFSSELTEDDFYSYIYDTSVPPTRIFYELEKYDIKENEDIIVLGKCPHYIWIEHEDIKEFKENDFIYLYLIFPSAIIKYINKIGYKKNGEISIDVQGYGDGWENLISNSLFETHIDEWLKNKNILITIF